MAGALLAIVVLAITWSRNGGSESGFRTFDGSSFTIAGESPDLSHYTFFLSLPELGGRRLVEVKPRPALNLARRELAPEESSLSDTTTLWQANRQGMPLFLSVEKEGWTAWLFAGTAADRPSAEDLITVGALFDLRLVGNGVVVEGLETIQLETHFTVPQSGTITVRTSWCLNEIVDGASVVAEARLSKCVVMEGASVGAGAVLEECLVFPGVTVGPGPKQQMILTQEGEIRCGN